MPRRLTSLERAEQVAALARRLGFGRAIDAVRPYALRALGTMEEEVRGLRLRAPFASHAHYIRTIKGGAEDYLLDLFVESIPEGGTVVDVGAHIGLFTLLAARAVGPSGRVIAVEPNPQTRALLQGNLALNGLAERVTVLDVAVSNQRQKATLHVNEEGFLSNLFSTEDGCEREVEVDCVPLDELLVEATPIHVMKLDVEGAEVAALQGSQGIIAASPDITLFCELNPGTLQRAGFSPDDLLAALAELDFQAQAIDERSRTLVPVERARFDRPFVDLLAKRTGGHRAS